jgi:hypothetical protein
VGQDEVVERALCWKPHKRGLNPCFTPPFAFPPLAKEGEGRTETKTVRTERYAGG